MDIALNDFSRVYSAPDEILGNSGKSYELGDRIGGGGNGAVGNDNDLVVAAECQNKVEAEAVRAMLNDKGINAMTVEKGSAMYINTESGAPLQVQVMGKELKRAQELIK